MGGTEIEKMKQILYVLVCFFSLGSISLVKGEMKTETDFKWFGSKEGITEEVLAPWTPIEVNRQKDGKDLKVGVWGRTYHKFFLAFYFSLCII